jgi:hypothetical protein
MADEFSGKRGIAGRAQAMGIAARSWQGLAAAQIRSQW